MSRRKLHLVEDVPEGACGAPTLDGTPCGNPAGANGRCWIPSHRPAPAAPQGGPKALELPEPPEHLGEDGVAQWNRHVAELARYHVLEQADLSVVAKAAEIWELSLRCWRAVQKAGLFVADRRGGVKKNPAIGKYLAAAKEYRIYAGELAALRGKGSPDSPEPDPLGDMLDF